MDIFHHSAKLIDEWKKLATSVREGHTPCEVTGVSAIHKAHFIAALNPEFGASHGAILVITEDEASANRLCDDINCMLSSEAAVNYPAKDFNLTPVEISSHEYEHKRLGVLSSLVRGSNPIVVASVEAALQFTIPADMLKRYTITLKKGEEIQTSTIASSLIAAGYSRTELVEGAGQFCIRGAIVDIFPVSEKNPVRLELWGDEIDQLNYFDVQSQRRGESLKQISIPPAQEVLFPSPEQAIKSIEAFADSIKGKQAEQVKQRLLSDCDRLRSGLHLPDIDKYLSVAYENHASIFDYMGEIAIMCEFINTKDNARAALNRHAEEIKELFDQSILCRGLEQVYMEFGQLQAQMEKRRLVYLDLFPRTSADIRLRSLITVNAIQTSVWGGELKLLQEDLQSLLGRGVSCLVLAGTDKAAKILADDLRGQGTPADYVQKPKRLSLGRVQVTSGTLSAGYEYPHSRIAVITHAKAVAASRKPLKRKRGEEIRSLSDIEAGDLVVHVSHGIGRYEGIQKLELQGVVKDYIKIGYAGTDTLYVPVTQLDMVAKYIGPKDDSHVKLNKLNSAEWQKTRSRVRAAVKEIADELIRLYAKRMASKGFAFSEDGEWQRQFEDHFSYQETDDQLRSINEIKADMQRPIPMDRLLCGDVGFGKTEVALRAAFKCVLDGKQCAILVPTTVLAWQHYQTMLKRMEAFPVKVELLSRFRNSKQQKQILKKLETGEIDIVVGTHRLVQDDVKFKDLGLVVIDEEQRFGVAHKERFKETFVNVDVLTLSATPIPRTLNMAMSGIRDMSVIEEPPQDRHPVQTYVIEHDMGIIAQAITKELRRGGQVYYIHNRIDTIEGCAQRVQDVVPQARIGIAHGRMSEDELLKIWQQLLEKEIDVLVCTTLIETGVDVQNCNTLIIEDADNMGLAQLYQLRGRVGRINRRAYAYFTFKRGKVLTEIAAKRLAAIREFTAFGSGFRIALRDMEIRGAGSILSARQHGHMEAVGYDLYLRLLTDAIAEQRGEAPPRAETECLIDLRIDAHIPEIYIESPAQRIDVYRKLASVRTREDGLDVIDELIDRYGEPPKAVTGLVEVALMRNMANTLGITEITQKGDSLLFYISKPGMEQVATLSAKFKGRVMLSSLKRPYISLRLTGENPLKAMRSVLETLAGNNLA